MGTRVIFFDELNTGHILIAADDKSIVIPKVKGSMIGGLWDSKSDTRHLFVVYDASFAHTYVLYTKSIDGPFAVFIGSTKLPSGFRPLDLNDGVLICLVQ